MFSAIAGAALVVSAFKFSSLNWIVDVPGWLVSHFVSVNLHEGEGAFGFVLALILSWLCASVAVGFLLFALRSNVSGFQSKETSRDTHRF
jgi:hypothetical protein